MAINPDHAGNMDAAVSPRLEHQVFHADEERELDERFAELSRTDEHLPSWTGTDSLVHSGVEHSAVIFGTFGSI